jgi:hypothetical protein
MQVYEHRMALDLIPESMAEIVLLEQIFGITTEKLDMGDKEAQGIIEYRAKYGKVGEGFPMYSLSLIRGRMNCYIGDKEEGE